MRYISVIKNCIVNFVRFVNNCHFPLFVIVPILNKICVEEGTISVRTGLCIAIFMFVYAIIRSIMLIIKMIRNNK